MNITPMELEELFNLAIAGDREANSQTNTAKGDNYSEWCPASMNKANQERDETARKLVELRKEFEDWKARRLQIDAEAHVSSSADAMRIQTMTTELATAIRDRDQAREHLSCAQRDFQEYKRTHPHPAVPESDAVRPAVRRKPWEVVGGHPTTFNETE